MKPYLRIVPALLLFGLPALAQQAERAVEVQSPHASAGTIAPAEAPADPAHASVRGSIEVARGRLPQHVRVRATPLEDGEPRYANLGPDDAFSFFGLTPGPHRFELVMPNHIVLAEGGEQVLALRAGTNVVGFFVARGRKPPAAKRSASGWTYKAWAIGGAISALVICEASDCISDDDDASPTAP